VLRGRSLRRRPDLLSEEGAGVDWAGKTMGPWIVLGIGGGETDENQLNRSAVMTTLSITMRSGSDHVEKRISLPRNHIHL
jgi:hypothetical protein